jgi:DNA-binding FrmR family transcriptional regulator
MGFPEEMKAQMQANVLSRLKKIEGQIRGLQGMVSEEKNCEDILTQVRAAQSALKAVSALILKNYLMKCLGDLSGNSGPEEFYPKLEQSIKVLAKFIEG